MTKEARLIQPFKPNVIPNNLVQELESFLEHHNFAELYKAYLWKNDVHHAGFPDIFRLEYLLDIHQRVGGITADDVTEVAKWGGLNKINQIQCMGLVLKPNTICSQGGSPYPQLKDNITSPLESLRKGIIKGIGPTYLSKVLRFICPQEYGAIDTRCVRVFGNGDEDSKCHSWLNLYVRNYGRWFIPEAQENWPNGYGRWIDILRFFAHRIPQDCPHPAPFVNQGLRSKNIWTCADVEMALFVYASSVLAKR